MKKAKKALVSPKVSEMMHKFEKQRAERRLQIKNREEAIEEQEGVPRLQEQMATKPNKIPAMCYTDFYVAKDILITHMYSAFNCSLTIQDSERILYVSATYGHAANILIVLSSPDSAQEILAHLAVSYDGKPRPGFKTLASTNEVIVEANRIIKHHVATLLELTLDEAQMVYNTVYLK